MKRDITIVPAAIVGLMCEECYQYRVNLCAIIHDVTPEIEPDVTFEYICINCGHKTYVDMSDMTDDFLGAMQYEKHKYR